MIKLGIGTAQFGMNYGISNAKGKVNSKEIQSILKLARESKISVIDTAQGYNDSESALGQYDLSAFKVVTKVSGEFEIELSLNRLNIESVYAVLLHNETECIRESWERLEAIKHQKKTQKIGISVYDPQLTLELIQKYPIEIIQCPISILDQRFIEILPILKKKNIEVHARSVFLQGLILMEREKVHPFFDPIQSVLKKIPKNKLEVALNFVNNLNGVDHIIVGVTSSKELQNNIKALSKKVEKMDYSVFKINENSFILPQNWKLT